MKKSFSLFIVWLTFIAGQYTLADAQHENRVLIQPKNQGSYQAGKIEYSFQLIDAESNKIIRERDLNDSHTKKLHLIAYDPSLKEFNHVHPIFDGNIWKVDLDLPVNGNYFIWVQGELSDNTEFSSLTRAVLINGKSANPNLPLGDVRKGIDNKTVFELANTKIKAGKEVMLNFKVSRSDGLAPVIKPYLGALAHVIATPAVGDELIHVHPMKGDQPNTGMIHATFPTDGEYRLWVQFIERDELKTIPLSVTVSK